MHVNYTCVSTFHAAALAHNNACIQLVTFFILQRSNFHGVVLQHPVMSESLV